MKNIDLPRKVRYRARRKKIEHKIDARCREGRTYEDYLKYIAENPVPVVQMDTVKGGIGGKVLLTLHFVESGFMLAILRNSNTSKSVIDIFTKLYRHLGRETFTKMFPVILTDNGTEFSNPLRLEVDENGEFRTRVFYCDRNRPDQKGSIEVNHEFKDVIEKYNAYLKSLNIKPEDVQVKQKEIEDNKTKMLEAMAKALKYKNINWELIQNPYVPNGLLAQINAENTYKQGQLEIAKLFTNMANPQTPMEAVREYGTEIERRLEETKKEKKTGEE